MHFNYRQPLSKFILNMNGILDVRHRSLKPELMDQPDIDWNVHREALEGLELINSFSLIYGPIWKSILSIAERKQKLKILDIATGAGDLPIMLARKTKELGFDFEIHACDKSPQAIRYNRQKANAKNLSVHFFELDIQKQKIPSGYDILVNSLFLHHLTEEETVIFLENMKSSKPKMMIIDDLIRSTFGLVLAYAGTRLLSRSAVVHYDGPQSVRAAYTLDDIRRICRKANLDPVTLKPLWPARFLMTWKN